MGCVASTLKIVGRPASPSPAGLELAHLGPPFHRHLEQRVHEVHSGPLFQKISASAENGSFNPCARHFGHNFYICLYIQCIGVHWRVPSGLLARQDVFGKGAGLAGLGEAGRPAASARRRATSAWAWQLVDVAPLTQWCSMRLLPSLLCRAAMAK